MRQMRTEVKAITIGCLLIILAGCNDSDKYHKQVEQELATHVRNDTLLQGIRFGMNKREFFAHCWELHKKGVFKEGATNTTVFYEMEMNNKKYRVNFYPNFSDGKISELPVEYTYAAFAPWNSKYSLDLLQKEITDYYREEYGEGYLEIKSKKQDKGKAYVWIDGNRRISVYKNISRNSVMALYFDLTSKKKIDVAPNDTDL